MASKKRGKSFRNMPVPGNQSKNSKIILVVELAMANSRLVRYALPQLCGRFCFYRAVSGCRSKEKISLYSWENALPLRHKNVKSW